MMGGAVAVAVIGEPMPFFVTCSVRFRTQMRTHVAYQISDAGGSVNACQHNSYVRDLHVSPPNSRHRHAHTTSESLRRFECSALRRD